MKSRKKYFRTSVVVMFLLLEGCISSEIIRPEYLETDTTHDIVISTQDSKTILLLGGEYRIVRDGENSLLRGRGELYLNEKRTETKPIDVEVSFSEIVFIETRDKTPFYYSGPIIMGAGIVGIVLLLVAMGGRGFGG